MKRLSKHLKLKTEKHFKSRKFKSIWRLQTFVFVAFLSLFFLASLNYSPLAKFLASPIFSSIYFLVIKSFQPKLSLLSIAFWTVFTTFLVDFVWPFFTEGIGGVVFGLSNFGLVLVLILLEIIFEELIEEY